MLKKIKINGNYYSQEELGLKNITIQGKTYVDVTPFWIDCKQSQKIKEYINQKDRRKEEE